MVNFKKAFFRSILWQITFCIIIVVPACKVAYSFSGADVPPEAKTFSVEYFQVAAPLASPTYAQKLSESLKDLILTQTRLDLSKSNGDLQFSGTIVNYEVSPIALQSNETAAKNRLSITVRVNYVNTFDEKKNLERTFTQFEDFDSSQNLSTVEQSLIESINSKLIQDIFNASLGNW